MEEFKCILSERNQYEKAMYCMIPTVWYSAEGKTRETVKRSVLCQKLAGGGMNRQSTEYV